MKFVLQDSITLFLYKEVQSNRVVGGLIVLKLQKNLTRNGYKLPETSIFTLVNQSDYHYQVFRKKI